MPVRASSLLFLGVACAAPAGFVTTRGAAFEVDGRPFRFAGVNNYYLQYQDARMVDDVFERAAARNFTVLRTWAFLDIGLPNGNESVGGGAKNGVWFRALDPATMTVVLNEGGLAHLDATLAAAAAHGMRLILTLTNNWDDFGGVDQAIRWETLVNASFTEPKHDDFFTRPWQIATFSAYAAALAQRTNSLTGVKYLDDPTIFSWELINEPRCQGSGIYKSSNNCTLKERVDRPPVATKIPQWVDLVSTALKAVDPNHLIAVGDEGFFCRRYEDMPEFAGDCSVGTDFQLMTALPHIDFGSMHLYPSAWGRHADDTAWGLDWIRNHTQIATALGKPVVLGEFGVKSPQAATYANWTHELLAGGTAGDLVWMLCGRQDFSPPWYPNYDGFCVYCANASDPAPPSGDPQACGVLAAHAAAMAAGQ